jgi:hypothetical protein
MSRLASAIQQWELGSRGAGQQRQCSASCVPSRPRSCWNGRSVESGIAARNRYPGTETGSPLRQMQGGGRHYRAYMRLMRCTTVARMHPANAMTQMDADGRLLNWPSQANHGSPIAVVCLDLVTVCTVSSGMPPYAPHGYTLCPHN